jgi:hypothetical protein
LIGQRPQRLVVHRGEEVVHRLYLLLSHQVVRGSRIDEGLA